MNRLLFIAYHFPPHGGAGVQRSLKFVKYLPDFGIQPTVLTSNENADRQWCPSDESLSNEIPEGTHVVRLPWPTDRSPGHRSTADSRLEEAAHLVATQQLEAIFVSMSPFSDAHFAALLSACCRIPWIADLRDPWALDEFQVYRTRWHRFTAIREMKRSLESAALIIMNTPEAVASFREAFPDFSTQRVVSITNGYDAADFLHDPELPANERFTVVHAGFLHATAGLRQRQRAGQYRLFGRTESGVELLPRSHYYLLQALEQWYEEDPSIRDQVELKLVGEPRPIDRELVAHSSVASMITFTGYLAHAESVNLIRQADLLFLPLHDLPSGRRATIVPGKTYEYLATGRPILAAVPSGDAQDFVTRAGTGRVCAPTDVEGMLRHLKAEYLAWKERQPGPPIDTHFVETFERRELTHRLAHELHALCGAVEPVRRLQSAPVQSQHETPCPSPFPL
jgi:glycosyltransferase involved in cell wall biosynthesis